MDRRNFLRLFGAAAGAAAVAPHITPEKAAAAPEVEQPKPSFRSSDPYPFICGSTSASVINVYSNSVDPMAIARVIEEIKLDNPRWLA